MQKTYALRIGDTKGLSFRIKLEIGLNKYLIGKWHALDLGAVKYDKGVTAGRDTAGTWFDQDLWICNDKSEICIRLDDYEGWLGPNDDGTGEVLQHCCLTLTPGKVTWVWEQLTG
ncbi:MAG TPA: hypothetical protein VKU01_24685 [Bryobacteraceae bacterium]|nr:hypothetical protein [Bryobacteraceae bacterium]